jgi:hypothetical protein
MLTIRTEQMEAFRKALDGTMLERVVAFLRAELPDAVAGLPDDVVRRRAERGLERAREYDFETDLSLISLVTMMFEFGPNFDRHPVVAKALRDDRDTPDDRMLTVVLELPERVWDELAILADADWGDGFEAPGEGG